MVASLEVASRTAVPETDGRETKRRATDGTAPIAVVRLGRSGPARRIFGGTTAALSTPFGAVAAAIFASEGPLQSPEVGGESASSCISGLPTAPQKVCEVA